MFRSLVFTAALSGLLVGLAISVLQIFGTVPLIARGETYEKASAPAHDHGAPGHSHAGTGRAAAPAATAPAPEPEGWEPADGLERNAYTLLFNVVERIGFALLLAGSLVLSGRTPSWREGFLWGLAGFAVFVLAPSIGLPPELPGIPAAPLGPRQLWWIATAASTAAALWLIVFRRSPVWAALAIVLLAAPHLIGAPGLDEVATAVPAQLSHRFVVAVLVTTLLSWSLLGALTGYFGGRFLPSRRPAGGPIPSS